MARRTRSAPGAGRQLALLRSLLLAGLLPAASAELVVKAPAEDTSTCGTHSGVADCDRPDLGSCGNACCALELGLQSTPEAVHQELQGFLESGADGAAFTYVPGEMPHGEHPADDIRGGGSEWKFIVQGTHTTSGKHYVDTLDFNIRSQDPSSSVLRMFSISDAHGALGDAGQNYKSLAYLMRSLGMDVDSAQVLHGCGAQTPAGADGAQQRLQGAARGGVLQTPGEAPTSTCGLGRSPPLVDCDRPDLGSCGNACCAVEAAVDASPEGAQEMLLHVLQGGGDNSSFAYVDGKDLRAFSVPFQFIAQGTHTTAGRRYMDTLDFNIRVADGATVLRAFSVSQLHGALGDAGQNYKSLAYVLSAMGVDRADIRELYGCGGAASAYAVLTE